ncbi:MAG: phosphate ABC transporter permease PstA [Candidatus Symbiobacter sp.]|nr:phosphate ABC transporter permease PstA [Candidatus Symbiobacter sp.]
MSFATPTPTAHRLRHIRRKFSNLCWQGLAWGAILVVVVILLWILSSLVRNGWPGLISADLYRLSTAAPGSPSGLANAIYGSLVITGVAIIIAAPIGILAGTWLAEYGRHHWLARKLRYANDVMLSTPSIIIGLFVYSMAVATTQHFSAWAGSLALAIIALPVIVRVSEDVLAMVPNTIREAAAALGAAKWRVIVTICYRAARQGLVTGILLSLARISGETAPLLFTVLGNQHWSTDFNAPMATLPLVIYNFARSPFDDQIALAWSGALLMTLFILALNLIARLFARRGGR